MKKLFITLGPAFSENGRISLKLVIYHPNLCKKIAVFVLVNYKAPWGKCPRLLDAMILYKSIEIAVSSKETHHLALVINRVIKELTSVVCCI